ncbi:hypothetical protein [Okeania sp. SIO1I7]|uniref:hypothetical protein n=1 Tax=Okeania sp. SIO1I7 TaxID=2607772 RepID=UPI0013FCD5F1|nr:hypothetical protein [Okeania sp. SIO1I7]NET29506.1 hypothetical protein [Okeania sp. SIO1I7]
MKECPIGFDCSFFPDNVIDGVSYCVNHYRCCQLSEALPLPYEVFPGKLVVLVRVCHGNTLEDLEECGWAGAWRIPYSFYEKESSEDYSCLEVDFPYDSTFGNEKIEAYQKAGWYEAVSNPNYSECFLSKEAEDRAREDFPQLFPDSFDVDFYDDLELEEDETICIMPTAESYPLEFFGFKPDGSDLL